MKEKEKARLEKLKEIENELYKDGAIIECINDENKGFIIKGNEVIWSPYVNIDLANTTNACISRLTTDVWHDINIVLATNTNDKFYKTHMYDETMSGNSVAMLFIDGVLVSLIDGEKQSFYSTNDSQIKMITLFAQYDYTNNIAQNFVKGEIMHIRFNLFHFQILCRFAFECKEDILLSHEHTEYLWLSYEDAISKLKWDSNKIALYELNCRITLE
mgnify:CR=1 FL=1